MSGRRTLMQQGKACWSCPLYSRTERRCRSGKANPRKKADAVALAEQLGLRSLCLFSPYRDILALRITDPGSPEACAEARMARSKKIIKKVS